MSEPEDKTPADPGVSTPERRFFSCAFYLFGMVVTAPFFAFFALRLSDPTWGGRFRNGWIDPAWALIVMPAIGAVTGFFLVLLANLAYVFYRTQKPRMK